MLAAMRPATLQVAMPSGVAASSWLRALLETACGACSAAGAAGRGWSAASPPGTPGRRPARR